MLYQYHEANDFRRLISIQQCIFSSNRQMWKLIRFTVTYLWVGRQDSQDLYGRDPPPPLANPRNENDLGTIPILMRQSWASSLALNNVLLNCDLCLMHPLFYEVILFLFCYFLSCSLRLVAFCTFALCYIFFYLPLSYHFLVSLIVLIDYLIWFLSSSVVKFCYIFL